MQEPVVFLPGLMADARLFGPQIAEFSRDHAVMVAPVHGGERVEEIASRLLDALPARYALVGQGLGGAVAMELARRAPGRLVRLALISQHALGETPQQAAERDPRIIRARSGRLMEALGEEFPPGCFSEVAQREDVLALVAEMAEGFGPEVFVRQSRAMQRRRDQQSAMMRLQAPTLLVCGATDPLVEVKRLETMAGLMPDARLCVIEDAGHWPTLEAPEALSQALHAWLAQPVRAAVPG